MSIDLETIAKKVDKIDEQFPEASRQKLKTLLDSFTAIIAILGVVGISGAGLLLYTVNTVTEMHKNTMAEIKSDLSIAKEKAKDELTAVVQGETLQKIRVSALEEDFKSRMSAQLAEATYANINSICTTVKAILESRQQNFASARWTDIDPHDLRETAYFVDSFMSRYENDLRQNKLPVARSNAIVYVMNGILEALNNRPDRALRWLSLASRTDPTLIEASILRIRYTLRGRVYTGNAKYAKDGEKKKSIELFMELEKSANESEKQSVEYALAKAKNYYLQSELEKSEETLKLLDKSVDILITRIKHDEKTEGAADPRLYALLASTYYKMARLGKESELYFQLSAEVCLIAVNKDGLFLRAVNNFIWYCMHASTGEKEKIRVLKSLHSTRSYHELMEKRAIGHDDSKVDGLFVLRHAVLHMKDSPGVRYFPAQLNSISEAMLVLENTADALQHADWAYEESFFHSAGAEINFMKERQEFVKKACNDLESAKTRGQADYDAALNKLRGW